MAAVADWAGRDVLDIGCGTGFHLPRFAATAASVIGVEPHPDLAAIARRRTRRLRARRGPRGAGAGPAGRRRLGRRRARPVGLLLRPRLRARAGRAGPRRTPRRHRVRDRQRRDPVDVRRLVPRAATPRSTRSAVERFWSTRGWDRHPLDVELASSARRADLETVVRIEFPPRVADEVLAGARGHHRRLRRQPLVEALLTRRTRSADPRLRRRCTGAKSHDPRLAGDPCRVPQLDPRTISSGASSTPREPLGRVAEQALERPDDLDRDLLERLPDRGEPGRHHLGDLGVVEADDGDVAAGDQAAVGQGVHDAHREGVGGAHERRSGRASSSSTADASRPLATVSSTREARPVVDRPRERIVRLQPAAAVLADHRLLAPADPGDPLVPAVEQVVGGELGAGGAVDVDPRVAGVGVVPGAAERDERRPPRLQPGRLRVAEVGVGGDEGVDGGRAQQVVVARRAGRRGRPGRAGRGSRRRSRSRPASGRTGPSVALAVPSWAGVNRSPIRWEVRVRRLRAARLGE